MKKINTFMHSTIQKTKKFLVLLMLVTLITYTVQKTGANAFSGKITFSGTGNFNVGQVINDGSINSTNITGIDLDIYAADSGSPGTPTGSLAFYQDIAEGLPGNQSVIVPIDVTSGVFTSIEPPKLLIIKSQDGSEFNFQSIRCFDYLGSEQLIKFEGFRDGGSTGFVTLNINQANYEETFTATGLTPSIFQNVDEIRISNQHQGDMMWGNYAGFNDIQIADPILPDSTPPSVTSVSVPSNGIYKTGQNLDFTVNFSENVTVNTASGIPYLPITLNTGGAVQASYVSGTGGSALEFRYTVQSGNLDTDGIAVGASFLLNGGTIKDAAGNNATPTLNSVASTTSVLVDGVAPTVTDARISISGATGTGGAYKIGDTVTAVWNNTVGGDNNSDISSVTMNFSVFGGGVAVPATNAAGVWTATYTMTSGSIDGTNRNVSVTATDNAGNMTTTNDTTNATVDNTSPTVTDGRISISGASGTGGAYKIGDTVTATWNNTAGGDNNSDTISSVTVDFSAFGGGAAVSATNSGSTWTATYTIASGAIDATNRNVSVTATDNTGNTTTTSDTTNATVDNISLTVTDTQISISGASGTGGVYKIGDTITATWNNTAGGDNNGDTISNVTMNFSAFGGGAAVIAINSGGTWTAMYTIAAGAIDGTSKNVSVTATDNAGNTTTAADTTNAAVDNVKPGVTDARISISGATGIGGAYKVGDTVTASWDNSAAGDNNSDTISGVTVNFTSFGGSAAVSATNASGIWTATYTIVAGTISGANKNVSVTATDDAGNSSIVADTTNAIVDNQIPTISMLTPLDNAVNIVGSANLVIAFSETVSTVTGNLTIKKTSDDSTVETIDVSGAKVTGTGTNTITINPDMVLSDETSYYVIIDATAFTDAAGNGFAGISNNTTWDFTTSDTTPPTIQGAVRDSNTQITVALSEASQNLVKGNNGGFTVTQTGAPGTTYVVSATVQGTDNQHVVLTVADLGVSAAEGITVTYTAAGNGTIQDLAGNALATDAAGRTIAAWDTTAPTVSSINRQTPSTASTNQTSVAFRVTFSEAVTSVDISDFTLACTGMAAGTIASVSASSGTTMDVTVNAITGTGTIKLNLNATGTGIADIGGTAIATGFSTGQTYTVDTIAPTILSATRNSNTQITVTLSEACQGLAKANNGGFTVIQTGAPGTTYTVSTTAQGADDLHVILTVADLEVSAAEGITVKYTAGGNGMIQDLAGNALATDGTGTTIVAWDTTAPTINISRQTPTSATTNHTSVIYRITFDEAVTGVDATDFTLIRTGTAAGAIASIASVNSTTWDVTVDTLTGDGILRLDLKATGTGIADIGGTPIAGGYTSGQTYTIDNTAPLLTAGVVNRTADSSATVKFTSNESGSYYYEVVAAGASAPTVNTSGAGIACTTAEITITNPSGLAAGAKDIYVKVKDVAGNVSNALKISIAAYVAPPVVVPDPTPTPTPTPTPSPEPSPTPSPTPQVVKEEITVNVTDGKTEDSVAKTTIERTTSADGTKNDLVTYEEKKAQETIDKLKQQGANIARIVIPDPKQEVSEVNVNLPKSTVDLLDKGNINLEIQTENARISVPKESLDNMATKNGEDLFFKVVPVKSETQRTQLEMRAKQEGQVNLEIKSDQFSVVGTPMVIETNMTSRPVEIVLPLGNVTLPTDAKERAAYLETLVVYIEHSDGTKEMLKGEMVEYKPGVFGIKFGITKFSTFTIVKLDKALPSSANDIVAVTSPKDTVINGMELTKTVDANVENAQIALTTSEKATWKLYQDATCTIELTDQRMPLKTGINKAYVKVTAEDGKSQKVYSIVINKEAPALSTQNDIASVDFLKNAKIQGLKIVGTVEYATASAKATISVSMNATWGLFRDADCQDEIVDKTMKLNVGVNKAYIKVTAEDGTTSKVYQLNITRTAKAVAPIKKPATKPEVKKTVVLIATNSTFSDAFAGQVLAKKLGGKVVLVGTSSKEVQNMANYITKNLTKKDQVYILGLGFAVKTNLEKILRSKGYNNLIRIGGADKYETAKLIAENMNLKKGTPLVLVNGEKLPTDTKFVQELCTKNGYPILFVQKNRLPNATIAAIKKISPAQVYLTGDAESISSKAISELQKKLGIKGQNIKRIIGGKLVAIQP